MAFMFTSPERAIKASAKLRHIMQTCVTISILRLSNLSAATPANGVKNSAGICPRKTESERMNTELVRL